MSKHSLASVLADAFESDYFIPILVSSQTRGMFESKNLPFGLGKTTLALDLSYILHGNEIFDSGWEDAYSDGWNEVFGNTGYFPSDVGKRLLPTQNHDRIKIPALIWDDVQKTAPSSSSVPDAIRWLAGSMTTNRPECNTLIFTAPNINSFSAPLRKLVVFELIVFERGKYEVQQIKYRKNFRDPMKDKVLAEFIEGNREFAFEQLPSSVQKRYDDWRAVQKLRDASYGIDMLVKYEKTRYQEKAGIPTLEEITKMTDDMAKLEALSKVGGKASVMLRELRKKNPKE